MLNRPDHAHRISSGGRLPESRTQEVIAAAFSTIARRWRRHQRPPCAAPTSPGTVDATHARRNEDGPAEPAQPAARFTNLVCARRPSRRPGASGHANSNPSQPCLSTPRCSASTPAAPSSPPRIPPRHPRSRVHRTVVRFTSQPFPGPKWARRARGRKGRVPLADLRAFASVLYRGFHLKQRISSVLKIFLTHTARRGTIPSLVTPSA
jgi:hypothetical protein